MVEKKRTRQEACKSLRFLSLPCACRSQPREGHAKVPETYEEVATRGISVHSSEVVFTARLGGGKAHLILQN